MNANDLAAYQRIRDAREARRREVQEAAGWTDKPARGWSRAARRKAFMQHRASQHRQGQAET